MGWHPGGLPESRFPTNDLLAAWQKDKNIELKVRGWQIRGWHFLVLAKKLVEGAPRDFVPFGPTLYQAAFTLYRHPSLSPSTEMDLPSISVREYLTKGPADRAAGNYRLLDAQE
jgi:hypothetical protein